MSIKMYNKLVRNRIPEIIEADGKRCIAEILSAEEYLRLLDRKLDEELAEYFGRMGRILLRRRSAQRKEN